MKQIQRGFTLIELVMVIVILGVLAAVAIPKFVDLKGDAQLSALTATAGAAAAASTINYAACAVANNSTTSGKCVKVSSCDSVKGALSGGVWPQDYSTATTGTVTNGATLSCTLTLAGYTPAVTTPAAGTFAVIGAGN
jgi:MSHA pilin protein MshA